MQKNNRIIIVTIKNCESCLIVKNIINSIVSNRNLPIDVIIKDKEDCTKTFLKENKIEDFPTCIFYKNDIKVFKTTGNYPSIVFIQWIYRFLI